MQNKISISIPCYNEKPELLEKSILSCLNQTYSDIEVLVVDDGSTDEGTLEIMQKYKKDTVLLRRERTSNMRSVSEANNLALENATGDWWHHDAADCWLESTWAEECMEFIKGREDEVGGVHTDFVTHHYDGHETHHNVRNVYDPKTTTFENYRLKESLGGWLFRMENAKKAGTWDTRFPRKQTREWTLRVLQFADLVYLPRELWHFIFHEPDQMKHNASIKYRILGDLKNGFPVKGNVGWALNDKQATYAMMEAFRAFFQDPEWKAERTSGYTAKKIAEVKTVTDEEASELWHGKL